LLPDLQYNLLLLGVNLASLHKYFQRSLNLFNLLLRIFD